jgi:hypothetical protein
MAISDRELNNKIISDFSKYNDGDYKHEQSSPKHLKILGDTMKDYFEEKTVVAYGWEAYLPPPASSPDPVKSFNSTVSFSKFELTAASNLTTLAALIQAAVIGAVINHPSAFAVTLGSFLVVTPLVLPQTTALDDALYSCITKPICAWYLSCVNSAPLPGTHSSYAGATTGMAIA